MEAGLAIGRTGAIIRLSRRGSLRVIRSTSRYVHCVMENYIYQVRFLTKGRLH